MPVASFDSSDLSGLKGYMECEKCKSKRVYFGGQGSWRQTIMCEDCFHVRKGVPLEIIWDLIASTYPNVRDRTHAQSIDEVAQDKWHATLAKHAIDPTKKVRG